MKNNYVDDYIEILERVLSIGYKINYSTEALEKEIALSSFFQKVESNHNELPIINTDQEVVKEIFKNENVNLDETPTYKQCLWAAESFLRIQDKTKLTFEAIFLYISIQKMYEFFNLYHEMDFCQIVDQFVKLHEEKSVLTLLLEKKKISIKELSDKTNIPYETLYSLKQRRRDIKNINVFSAVTLASLLNVRVETLAELSV